MANNTVVSMGKFTKHERLEKVISDHSEQLEAMEKRYRVLLDNLVGNNTKANSRAEKMLSETIVSKRNEIKRIEQELKNLTCSMYE